MLKIKDNVDLKELEKFEFEKVNISWGICTPNWYEKSDNGGVIRIREDKDKTIEFVSCLQEDTPTEMPDAIFDLIQAGFVEKVEKK